MAFASAGPDAVGFGDTDSMHRGPGNAEPYGLRGRPCHCDLAVKEEGWGRQDALRGGIVDCELAAKRLLDRTVDT